MLSDIQTKAETQLLCNIKTFGGCW